VLLLLLMIMMMMMMMTMTMTTIDTGTVSVQLHREDQNNRCDVHDSVGSRHDRLVDRQQPRAGCRRVRVRDQKSAASRQRSLIQQLSTSYRSVSIHLLFAQFRAFYAGEIRRVMQTLLRGPWSNMM